MMPTSRPSGAVGGGIAVTTAASTSNGTSSALRSNKATLEIIPDTRFIVFHGSEHEAQSVRLRGIVRLTSPESMSISRPRVRLEGKRKIAWWYTTGLGAGEISDKRVFWHEEQKLGMESTHKIKAGVMEWPFEFELAPAMPESVEGLRDTYIAYHLHASVARSGWNTKPLFAQEHIRIVRTLGPDSMEMTRSRVNADIWANKISYSISIPSDAVVFGTSITADVELSPIRKGLRMGKVELKLVETVIKRIQVSDVPDARADRVKSDELEVAKETLEFPEHAKALYEGETTDDPVMADEMYKFKATLPMPKSLNLCRQDVDSHQISITHRFKLMVNIHNPEGHVSQLVCKLPVKLFISPNLPVDESNHVAGVVGITEESLNQPQTATLAPPQYGQHQLDQIFSDVDTAGYLSRGGSVSATPAGLNSRSRRASQENLASLNGVANANISTSPSSPSADHGSATPSILRSRLAALQERGLQPRQNNVSFALSTSNPTSPPPGADILSSATANTLDPSASSFQPMQHTSYFPDSSGNQSASSSTALSRRGSDDGDTAGALSSSYNMSDLTRVPSYGAALRTPGAVTPYTEGPPSYVEATSRPSSPGPGSGSFPSFSSSPNISHRAVVQAASAAAHGGAAEGSMPAVGAAAPPMAPLARPSRAHVRGAEASAASTAARGVPVPGAVQSRHGLPRDEDASRVWMLRAQT